jgi:serine phosphatase RsbU (regulator of sigma subunit)
MTVSWFTTFQSRLKMITQARKEHFSRAIFGNDWQCPYCGTLAVKHYALDTRWSLIEGHLRKCVAADELRGRLLTVRQLDEAAKKYHLARSMSADSAWRIFDTGGAWACPYCGEKTAATGRGAALVDDILEHLTDCRPYIDGRKPLSSEELRGRVAERAKTQQRLEHLISQVHTQSVLRYSDANRHWVCPFCEKAVDSIDMSSALLLEKVMPEQAARHMLSGACSASAQNFRLRKTDAGMQALVDALNRRIASGEMPSRRRPTDQVTAIRKELAVDARAMAAAASAQARMLPREAPRLEGYEISWLFEPAGDLSGDFVDLQPLGAKWLSVTVGDVSGHDLASGMVMSMVRKAVALRAADGNHPATILAKVNRDIRPDLEPGTFVTALHGLLDAEAHTFTFARAGHSPPVIAAPDSRPRLFEPRGACIGIMDGNQFLDGLEEAIVEIPRGGCILLYTDGLVEAQNLDGEEFGPDRLLFAVNLLRDAPNVNALLAGVLKHVRTFAGTRPFEDDVTMVAVRRKK